MNLKKRWEFFIIFLIISTIVFPFFTYSQEQKRDTLLTTAKTNKNGNNEKCLKCHGQNKYEIMNSDSTKTIRKRMYGSFLINRKLFSSSNHRNLNCTDCHSDDYSKFPHKGELQLQEKAGCMDCHGGDEKYAKYQFEKINDEYIKSVHSTKHSKDFTCWMCHDPHYYKINARNKQEIVMTVAYDNSICLSCHADLGKYQLISDNENPNILVKHDWLPNQSNHFKHVRCIECHARINDSIMVSHNVQPKQKAVKLCVQCHSKNSLLLHSLYKFESSEKLTKRGFFNAAILKESYVVGANRNYFLNVISVVLFIITAIIILIHSVLRILIKNKKQKNG